MNSLPITNLMVNFNFLILLESFDISDNVHFYFKLIYSFYCFIFIQQVHFLPFNCLFSSSFVEMKSSVELWCPPCLILTHCFFSAMHLVSTLYLNYFNYERFSNVFPYPISTLNLGNKYTNVFCIDQFDELGIYNFLKFIVYSILYICVHGINIQ